MIFITLLTLGLPTLIYYIYGCLRRFRGAYATVPALKRSFVFGNILEMGKYMKPGKHPGMYCNVSLSHSSSFSYPELELALIVKMKIMAC